MTPQISYKLKPIKSLHSIKPYGPKTAQTDLGEYKITRSIFCLKLLDTRPCSPMARAEGRDAIQHDEGDIRPKEKSLLDITIDKITTRNSKDLFYGTLTGWIAGVSLVRIGKVAAFGLGGGVILLHFASECGYIHVNWERVRDAAKTSQEWVDTIMRFVKKNSCYSVGFIGGFFFGVASM